MNEAKYPELRAHYPDYILAQFWKPNKARLLREHMKRTDTYTDEVFIGTLESWLVDVKVHERCIYSVRPEVVVATHAQQLSDARMRPSRLATDLYFRHCDGSFQNVCFERLQQKQ